MILYLQFFGVEPSWNVYRIDYKQISTIDEWSTEINDALLHQIINNGNVKCIDCEDCVACTYCNNCNNCRNCHTCQQL